MTESLIKESTRSKQCQWRASQDQKSGGGGGGSEEAGLLKRGTPRMPTVVAVQLDSRTLQAIIVGVSDQLRDGGLSCTRPSEEEA